jgi:hypothetical protein
MFVLESIQTGAVALEKIEVNCGDMEKEGFREDSFSWVEAFR